jgi:hypothetical protein
MNPEEYEFLETRIRTQKKGGTGNKYSFNPKKKSWQRRGISLPCVSNKNVARDERIRAEKRERRVM